MMCDSAYLRNKETGGSKLKERGTREGCVGITEWVDRDDHYLLL